MKQMEVEVVVIGAGPAGLSAACQARMAGAQVLVIDENNQPGGQLFKQIHKFFGSREHQAGVRGYEIGQKLLEKTIACGASVMLDSLVYGIQPDLTLGVIKKGENIALKAQKIIVATGAKENYLPFPGSTLPGVMGAGAAQTMINVNRVLPGKRAVMMGSGNVGLIVSYQLMQAGAEVAAIVEGAPCIGGYGVHAGKIRRAGVPFYLGYTVKRALGEQSVEGVEIIQVNERFQPIPGTEKLLKADTICLAVGLNPMNELLWQAGCHFDFIPAFGGHVPLHDSNMETTICGVYAAGDATGVEEASSAMEEGNLAGVAAAEALGYLSYEEAACKKAEIQHRLDTLRDGPFGQKRRAFKEQQLADMKAFDQGSFMGRMQA
ncbi:NAD(P)/FAD-dependent oxidoreductase [Oscillospiraceae bacterium MB08-C2-2]|nr:NAD(P)/FAD-dependent oxidoreductase [Oscillospiraceae bacterium MB08-C2-2]